MLGSKLRRKIGKWGLAYFLMGAILVSVSGTAGGQSVTPVAKLDQSRFSGTWYELARYPNKAQKRCVSDAIVLIALGDKRNRIQIVNSCKTKNGYTDTRNASGKAQDKLGDGKLKVSYLWPFSTKIWVLGVGAEYDWALVGSPNHKSLWVLSKTPALAPEVVTQIQGMATAQGFALDKLVKTPQETGSGGVLIGAASTK